MTRPSAAWIACLTAVLFASFAWITQLRADAPPRPPVTIGSKAFTESVILGEILQGLVSDAGLPARHRRQLGGTRVLWGALLAGDIDAYPEYTGTILREILAGEGLADAADLEAALARRGIAMTAPLGFNNTYAIGLRRDMAEKRRLSTISDLAHHQDLALGFSNEFMDRGDGWAGLRAHYGLPHRNVRGLDHDLAYRAVSSGDIAATDVYTTDAEIAYYDLVLLEDNRGFFPAYEAVILYRLDLAERAPAAVAALSRLEGRIDASRMREMNKAAKLDGTPESETAARFLAAAFLIETDVRIEGVLVRLARNTVDHLTLVAISLAAAIAVSVPLGILAARRPGVGQVILGVAGIVQTVPTLALFVFMIPLLGIGGPPAIAALFLYSLLPIIRNTHAGLVGIAPSVTESAEALGLPSGARLRLVELPIAARTILAGIKTSAVINVGTATLGALIGAGGYGQPILTGIRLDDIGLILEGALPAALLALAVQGAFELAERRVVPKGMRIAPTA